MKITSLLLASIAVLGFSVSSHAAIITINTGTAGNNEAGITFQLTNNQATDTIRLSGLFTIGTNGGASQEFRWFAASGNTGFVSDTFGNAIEGGSDWSLLASTTPDTIVDSDNVGNPQTSLNFGSSFDILAGQTVTFALVQTSNATKTIKYVSNAAVYTPVDSIVFTGYRGLGSGANSDLTSSGFNLQNFGTGVQSPANFRGFLGTIDYSVVAVPEPGTYAALAGLLALVVVFYRRRKL